ncbi:MAG: PVC-type heme-binding CxxCH protein, partial [Gemmataceae bacterium]
MRRVVAGVAVLSSLGLGVLAVAVPPEVEKAQKTAAADAAQAATRATVDKSLKVSVWATEPLMANPVAFGFDAQGRCYVAETTRFDKGVPDTRGHMQWLDEDIGARTVADRLAMYKKHKYEGFSDYDDTVRMVWDSTGSGKADKSTVFAKGFNQMKDGLGAGILARKGGVYFTCIPDLYWLQDTKNTGTADVKKSLATGFGVRAQFLGHDLHGLRMGPDGKLYFSIGDRGLNVVNAEGKTLFLPDTGAVLRCKPDGTELEMVHTGLRNPQEIAFDDFGNLFTYDNNSDSGDQARWVYIVEGGDSGWRCGYQYGTMMHTPSVPQGNRGPWNTEKIWHTQTPDQPAYVVPPLKHFGNGPAGMTHYPGIGLSPRYADHFFACDFTASPSSKIWSLAVKPKGAAFEVTDLHTFVQNMVPTDCDFGPDGAFYWSDWTGGWSPPNKGRLFRVSDADAMKNPQVAEAQKLLAAGFEKTKTTELIQLL